MYRDCMTPAASTQRCRPFWRSKSPEDEARKRNDELLDARGEEVTLLTRRIKGDDIIDRHLFPVYNNFVPALALNWIFLFDSSKQSGNVPGRDMRFSDNMSHFLSDPRNAKRYWSVNRDRPTVANDKVRPIILHQRPEHGNSDYIYVGNKTKISNLSIQLFTRLKSDNVIWEYTRGNGVWFPITIIPDETTPGVITLQESGRMVFNISFFPFWKQDYVNGEQAYWVRARIDENTNGQASAVMMFTEHIMQHVEIWNQGDDSYYFPNDKCVTIKVNGKIFNRVYDLHELDYAQESFVLMRRDQLSPECPLNKTDNDRCGLTSMSACDTDPMDHIDELGNLDLARTNRLRHLAYLYSQLMRTRQKAAGDAVIALFTRDLRLDSATITAIYTNMCPCTAYGRMQAIRDGQQPDDSVCGSCYGTEFINGFERFVNPIATNGKILMSFPASPFDMPLEEHGLGKTQELTTARLSYTPKIFVRDIIVRYNELGQEIGRYIVMTRTDSIGRRGILLHQEVVLQLLDPDKIEYRVELPDLPLAPTQKQVLQSLGVLVPDDPGLSTCEELRLYKGKKDCRPFREKLTE